MFESGGDSRLSQLTVVRLLHLRRLSWRAKGELQLPDLAHATSAGVPWTSQVGSAGSGMTAGDVTGRELHIGGLLTRRASHDVPALGQRATPSRLVAFAMKRNDKVRIFCK